jgi:hypothetical protein
LPVGQARGDHHAVGERGAAGQIHGHYFLRLVILQAADDQRLQSVEFF